ncbi:hypothetical protein LTR10_013312 [Elasticomyces elasticus]|uniref:DUF1868 domain-containing protein n=1 Tax=Exophiala sideris TaxID=1016849 RepID=A0ABR0J6N5_9EURO|nr:hypothetical protein LTR10_013312 [Elasticomyces elasticus]KAK5027458.1 hypothetical protein LTS07_007060 [Exophiala sideris]KAK5034838.1 hypothetical protein LTR13_006020 [Exophiala sideris]KAK5056426.1 hypothetical protein LTR69_007967 [Exophiala sideris]KAK5181084.1 hypothetical protein LTR44_006415 [Eurotiomycetes sp. CCFEE 6388]
MAISVSTVNEVLATPNEHGIENGGWLSDQQEQRIEPVPKNDFPHQQYPRWIGHKFEPDGRVLPFPGHTIICHLPQNSSLYDCLLLLHNDLQRQDFAACYVLLPPSSWHMTVYEGVSDQIRKRTCWPGDCALDAPLESCTTMVREKLASFDLRSEPPFRMTIAGWEPLEDGIALKIVPASLDEERRLRGLRDRLSKLLRMRHPGHDTYSFHVSLAYMLRFLGQQDHQAISAFLQSYLKKLPKTFELGAPEFCIFDDMFAFQRELYLKKQS